MLFDAIIFLSGSTLFLVAVLLFVLTWRERGTIAEERAAITEEQQALVEKNVEMDIWHRELQVWHQSLENEQRQLEEDRRKLLMLAAPDDTQSPYTDALITPPPQNLTSTKADAEPEDPESQKVKNLKFYDFEDKKK